MNYDPKKIKFRYKLIGKYAYLNTETGKTFFSDECLHEPGKIVVIYPIEMENAVKLVNEIIHEPY